MLFTEWKNFANPPKIDKVIAMVMVAPFFDSRCRLHASTNVVLRCGVQYKYFVKSAMSANQLNPRRRQLLGEEDGGSEV